MDVQVLDGGRDVTGGYKVDVSRGERGGRGWSERVNPPHGERFLSLPDPHPARLSGTHGCRSRLQPA